MNTRKRNADTSSSVKNDDAEEVRSVYRDIEKTESVKNELQQLLSQSKLQESARPLFINRFEKRRVFNLFIDDGGQVHRGKFQQLLKWLSNAGTDDAAGKVMNLIADDEDASSPTISPDQFEHMFILEAPIWRIAHTFLNDRQVEAETKRIGDGVVKFASFAMAHNIGERYDQT